MLKNDNSTPQLCKIDFKKGILQTSNARLLTRLNLGGGSSGPRLSFNQLFTALGNVVFAGRCCIAHQRLPLHFITENMQILQASFYTIHTKYFVQSFSCTDLIFQCLHFQYNKSWITVSAKPQDVLLIGDFYQKGSLFSFSS